MKRIISLFIIGAIALTFTFALVSCTDGEEEFDYNPIIEGSDNDGDWDLGNEGSYTTEHELGGIPLE